MNQDTTGADAGAGDATLLLSLDGLAVTGVERSAAGTLLVEVATAAETAAACPTAPPAMAVGARPREGRMLA